MDGEEIIISYSRYIQHVKTKNYKQQKKKVGVVRKGRVYDMICTGKSFIMQKVNWPAIIYEI